MAEDIYPVQWTGQQAVVRLPEHIDTSNADQVRERLLSIINRGAAVLITDMAATISCDYSGADAVARAYQRAVANGTQLRLVVVADVVRRVLSLSGLDRLISTYPTLEGAVAAGVERRDMPGKPGSAATSPAVPEVADLVWAAAADHADRTEELLASVVNSILNVGLNLQAAIDLPSNLAAQRIAEAIRRLDDLVQEVHHHVFAERRQRAQPDLAGEPPPKVRERSALTRDRKALLHKRVVQTANALQRAAADTAALLERQADLFGQPGLIDYPTEIKRWRVFADQIGQTAKRWEQRL